MRPANDLSIFCGNIGRWEQEAGVIEDVANQRHEVEVQPFGELEILHDGHVVGVESRSIDDINSAVAEPSRRRSHEAGSVKPLIDGALTGRQVAIGPDPAPLFPSRY